jgi:hypothetical protein
LDKRTPQHCRTSLRRPRWRSIDTLVMLQGSSRCSRLKFKSWLSSGSKLLRNEFIISITFSQIRAEAHCNSFTIRSCSTPPLVARMDPPTIGRGLPSMVETYPPASCVTKTKPASIFRISRLFKANSYCQDCSWKGDRNK